MNNQLPESRLFSFLHEDLNLSITFLEGQKLINDLAVIHSLNGKAFHYSRGVVLSLLPMIYFLKPNEGLGIFIDAEQPYFRFKLECNFSGTFRTMLLPEDFQEFPEKFSGKCRIAKLTPASTTPYVSIIEINNLLTTDVINRVLEQSYQLAARVIISDDSDQAVLLTQLPPKNYDKDSSEKHHETIKDQNLEQQLLKIMQQALTDEQKIIERFTQIGSHYLHAKDIKFYCPCSKELMLRNLKTLGAAQLETLFKEDGVIRITCDYCKQHYEIVPADMEQKLTN